jgi:chromosome segregation ATPase
MAAVEETEPVVLAEEAPAPAGAPAAAEEEKEIPKPDMNVKQPDEEEFAASVSEVQVRLDGHHKRIAEIKAVLDARENVKNASSGESGQARSRLQELRTQSRALSGERNAIYQEISEQEDLRKLRTASMAELKKAIPYSSVEDIDRAIKEKEHYQETNALPLNAIKKLMAEVKEMQVRAAAIVLLVCARRRSWTHVRETIFRGQTS